MKITCFQATTDGGSRFHDLDVSLSQTRQDEFGHTIHTSLPYASPNVQFVELPANMDQDWHNAPAQQIVVVLSGVIEVETTDGAVRQWKPGSAFCQQMSVVAGIARVRATQRCDYCLPRCPKPWMLLTGQPLNSDQPDCGR